MKQGNLWHEGNKQPASKSLIIGKRQKEALSKQQQAFNRLIKKIEKLRQELEQTAIALNSKLDFYGKHIYPVQQQLNELRKECTRLLYQFFKIKKLPFPLSKKEKSSLKEVIALQLKSIFSFGKEEPDDEFKEIFKAVEGISYEKAAEQDFADMKEEMQDMFKQFGFDMDFDGINSKMTQEEVMKKMAEMQDQFKQQAAANEQQFTARKKTKKQLEREAKEKLIEEARTKNISTIYKQLAKAFHPDLEQDEELKIQKEELMKQLTAAYENNDLHTLLRLELSWIQKEENNPDKLSDEKLAIYNQVLKEQVEELEDEIIMLIDHPRYQPLHTFVRFTGALVHVNLNQEKSRLQGAIKEITGSINKLKGTEKQALAEIKAVIYTIQQQREMDAMMSKLFR